MAEDNKPQYVYMMIPTEWVCVYHKLLVYLSDFGLEMLNDCQAGCKGRNKTITDCWNVFQSALAAKALGKDKQAELFITYIKAQLKSIYKVGDKEEFEGGYAYPIDENGELYAMVSCSGYDGQFDIDPSTGQLVLTTSNSKTAESYNIDNNQLTYQK